MKTTLAASLSSKVCNKCNIIDISSFTLKSASPDGHSNICRSCVREQKQLSRYLALKHIDDKLHGRINDDRERLQSMTLLELKSLMKANNIPIRQRNKAEIIELLLSIPEGEFKSCAELDKCDTRSTRAPKQNIRNRARRVKLVNLASSESGLDNNDELLFPSIYKTARYLGCNSNEVLSNYKFKSRLDPDKIYSIEILDKPLASSVEL